LIAGITNLLLKWVVALRGSQGITIRWNDAKALAKTEGVKAMSAAFDKNIGASEKAKEKEKEKAKTPSLFDSLKSTMKGTASPSPVSTSKQEEEEEGEVLEFDLDTLF
jgi:hypothetical protein